MPPEDLREISEQSRPITALGRAYSYVVSVTATNAIDPVLAARVLGLPLGQMRSASRSASAKLDRAAATYAAGRMCQLRPENLLPCRGFVVWSQPGSNR